MNTNIQTEAILEIRFATVLDEFRSRHSKTSSSAFLWPLRWLHVGRFVSRRFFLGRLVLWIEKGVPRESFGSALIQTSRLLLVRDGFHSAHVCPYSLLSGTQRHEGWARWISFR